MLTYRQDGEKEEQKRIVFEEYVARIDSVVKNEDFYKLGIIEDNAENDFIHNKLTYEELCLLRDLILYKSIIADLSAGRGERGKKDVTL